MTKRKNANTGLRPASSTFDLAAALLTEDDWARLVERFWERIERRGPDDCWPCKHPLPNGYGQMKVSGHNVGLHRIGFLVQFGVLDPLLDVLHSCDNPPCGNGAHLSQGTALDNNRDMLNKGRHWFMRGEQLYNAKLTDEKVREVRRLYATGGYSHRALAAQFQVSSALIQYVVVGKAWQHVSA